MLDTPCSEVVWKVLTTYSIRQFPLHFLSRASPCAITFQLESKCGSVTLWSFLSTVICERPGLFCFAVAVVAVAVMFQYCLYNTCLWYKTFLHFKIEKPLFLYFLGWIYIRGNVLYFLKYVIFPEMPYISWNVLHFLKCVIFPEMPYISWNVLYFLKCVIFP